MLEADSTLVGEPLPGGVSSDIWRVSLPGRGDICVKRALPKLKVAADWRAPTARSLYEAFGYVRDDAFLHYALELGPA